MMKNHKQRLVVGSTVIVSCSILVGFVWQKQEENNFQKTFASEESSNLMTASMDIMQFENGNVNGMTRNVEEQNADITNDETINKQMDEEILHMTGIVTLEEKYGEAEVIMYQTRLAEEESMLNQLMIADVNNYVNIRSQPEVESEVVGKLYQDSVGVLLAIEKDWYCISSGSVEGYVKAEYVLTGEEAKIRADEVGVHLAKVKTTTLKVREEASAEAKVMTLVPDGDILAVLEQEEDWVKVATEEGDGYVSVEYVDTYTVNVEAESTEEERIRLEKEEAEREAARAQARAAEEARLAEIKKVEEAKKAADAAKKAEAQKAAEKAQAAAEAEAKKKAESANQSTKTESSTTNNQATTSNQNQSTSNTALGQQIVSYAVQFVGNPYVYGGTSLTEGIDCSGFVMRVYQHFGINLPRTSGEQGASGSKVSGIANAQPGDLIWYSGHIGIYMGNGQVVHASNAKEGIKISQATYRTILGIRRIV